MLKCVKFDFRWGSAPDPAGGAHSAPPDPLAGFKGRRGGEGKGGGRTGKKGGKASGRGKWGREGEGFISRILLG